MSGLEKWHADYRLPSRQGFWSPQDFNALANGDCALAFCAFGGPIAAASRTWLVRFLAYILEGVVKYV